MKKEKDKEKELEITNKKKAKISVMGVNTSGKSLFISNLTKFISKTNTALKIKSEKQRRYYFNKSKDILIDIKSSEIQLIERSFNELMDSDIIILCSLLNDQEKNLNEIIKILNTLNDMKLFDKPIFILGNIRGNLYTDLDGIYSDFNEQKVNFNSLKIIEFLTLNYEKEDEYQEVIEKILFHRNVDLKSKENGPCCIIF